MGVTNHLHIFLLLYPLPSPAPSQGRWWVCTAVPLCHPACPLLFWLCHGKPTLSQASAGSGVFLVLGAGARCPWIPGNCLFPLQLLPSICRHKHHHHLLTQQLHSLTPCCLLQEHLPSVSFREPLVLTLQFEIPSAFSLSPDTLTL